MSAGVRGTALGTVRRGAGRRLAGSERGARGAQARGVLGAGHAGAGQAGEQACHAPIPGPTRLADPNRVPGRETQD